MYKIELDNGLDRSDHIEFVNKIHRWCEQNCTGKYFIDSLSLSLRVTLMCEIDATAFKLAWL